MEQLLDAADALARTGRPERPDFHIPDEFPTSPNLWLDRRISETAGWSWFSRCEIPAGTMLLAAKPIAMAMDYEDDTIEVIVNEKQHQQQQSGTTGQSNQDFMDDGSERDDPPDEPEPERLNELLLIKILHLLRDDPSIWIDSLSNLFPRALDLPNLPAWVCPDDQVFLTVESLVRDLRQVPALRAHATDISQRLALIIRYNVLSLETCSELLSYPGPQGHSSLAGVGVYYLPSFFNHSSTPNCNRWAIGDVMVFVSNQTIPANTQVCISYLEHDVLCESAFRRNQLLSMDFYDLRDGETQAVDPLEESGPEMPVVDSDVQNELMTMNPFERLSAIEKLLQQATGETLPEDEYDSSGEGMEEEGGSAWFKCDAQNLIILKAITLEAIGQSKEAMSLWEQAIAFVKAYLPPADESLIVLNVQAALCAHYNADFLRAKQYATAALENHRLLFGGGVERFRRRFRHEFKLALRPNPSRDSADSHIDLLWPIAAA
jgi:hypothetical protein